MPTRQEFLLEMAALFLAAKQKPSLLPEDGGKAKEEELPPTTINLHVVPGIDGHAAFTRGVESGLESAYPGQTTLHRGEYPASMDTWLDTAKKTIKSDKNPWIMVFYSAGTVVGQVLANDICKNPSEYPKDITFIFMYPVFAGEISPDKIEEKEQMRARNGGEYNKIVKEPVQHKEFTKHMTIRIIGSENDRQVPFIHAITLGEATGVPVEQLPREKDRGHQPAAADIVEFLKPTLDDKVRLVVREQSLSHKQVDDDSEYDTE